MGNGASELVLFSLVIVIVAAKIGEELSLRLGQPEVLGELAIGLLLGNLSFFGVPFLEYIRQDPSLDVLSQLGVVLLLFQVGLETAITDMARVGLSSLFAAVLGVVTPFVLGWAVASFMVPDAHFLSHFFVGATLTATSVGITARVLRDLGKTQTGEGKIILGAAVIDDVLGLVVLTAVTGIIGDAAGGTKLDSLSVLKTIVLATGFLVVAVGFGQWLMPRLYRASSRLQSRGVLLALSVSICFAAAHLATLVGLASIVGAFVAGLVLEPERCRQLAGKPEEASIEQLLEPLTDLFVPVFFVVMGAKVDLLAFSQAHILVFAVLLTLAAVLGKQACALGVLQHGVDRLTVGFGMIPRGEVGLIVLGIGTGLMLEGKPLIDSDTYSAVVVMIMLTTMIGPTALKWRFARLEQDNKSAVVPGDISLETQ